VPKSFKIPKNLVNEWPEIFEDMYISTMPVEYLHSIKLEFHDGRVWEIAVDDQLTSLKSQAIADRLIETLYEYANDVKKIDFKVNVEKLKTDIKKEIRKIL
jgi:ribosomal protein S18 acetylase RimI-like enzyme